MMLTRTSADARPTRCAKSIPKQRGKRASIRVTATTEKWSITFEYRTIDHLKFLRRYVMSSACAAEPFQGSRLPALKRRVASVLAGLTRTRQPWAGGRNPFGIVDRKS